MVKIKADRFKLNKMVSKRSLLNIGLTKDLPEVNVAIIGPDGVGKSALAVKYLTKRFIMEYDPNLEDTYQKSEIIDGQEFIIKLMDTSNAGDRQHERYLKWAHGIIVVYSITNKQSFDDSQQFLETVNQYEKDTGKSLTIALLGNKVDLERYRTVSKSVGEETALKYDCIFQETSAADDYLTIEKTIQEVIRDIIRNSDRHFAMQPLFITEDSKSGLLTPGAGVRSLRRTKSPHTSDIKDLRNSEKDSRLGQKKTPSSFKIFNKRFNLFN